MGARSGSGDDRSTSVEREVKLGLEAGRELPDLDGVVPGVTAVGLGRQRLTATYYDTADLRLARWGVTVRHRRSEASGAPQGGAAPAQARGGPAELAWTVKLPADSAAPEGGLARIELEFSGPEAPVPAAVAQLVRGMTRAERLVPVARLRSDRRRVELRSGAGSRLAELDDDDVSVLVPGPTGRGRRVGTRFREVELELMGADPTLLDAVVRRLRSAGAGAADPTPKVVRALGPRALEPPDVVPIVPGKKAMAAEAVRSAIAGSAVRLIRHDPSVRLGDDPEAVHQARVATRRLRSDLRTFGLLLDEDWAGALRQELGWIAGLLGAVRDADVLIGRLRSRAGNLPAADAKPAAALLRRLDDQRHQSRTDLVGGMDSARYTALVDRLVGAAADPVFARSAPTAESAAVMLPRLVRRSWRRLQRAVTDLGDSPSDDDLHQVRIQAKRCRYAAEAAISVVGKPARQLAVAVADLQGVLGDFHDAIVAEAWLRRAAAGAPAAQAFVAGELAALEGRQAAEGRAGWQGPWNRASAAKLRAWLDG